MQSTCSREGFTVYPWLAWNLIDYFSAGEMSQFKPDLNQIRFIWKLLSGKFTGPKERGQGSFHGKGERGEGEGRDQNVWII